MIRLFLVAHAPTTAQRFFRFPADEGIEPIDSLVASRLAARIGRCDAIWRGPERRSDETARALGVVASPCDDVRAWSAGVWSGQAVASVVEHDPDGFGAWRTDPDASPAGGESLRALVERVAHWMKTRLPATGRVLLIADPAVIRAAIVHVLDAPLHTFWRLDVAPLSLAVVQSSNGEWRLRSLSEGT